MPARPGPARRPRFRRAAPRRRAPRSSGRGRGPAGGGSRRPPSFCDPWFEPSAVLGAALLGHSRPSVAARLVRAAGQRQRHRERRRDRGEAAEHEHPAVPAGRPDPGGRRLEGGLAVAAVAGGSLLRLRSSISIRAASARPPAGAELPGSSSASAVGGGDRAGLRVRVAQAVDQRPERRRRRPSRAASASTTPSA